MLVFMLRNIKYIIKRKTVKWEFAVILAKSPTAQPYMKLCKSDSYLFVDCFTLKYVAKSSFQAVLLAGCRSE